MKIQNASNNSAKRQLKYPMLSALSPMPLSKVKYNGFQAKKFVPAA
jgi:hypothetical protein